MANLVNTDYFKWLCDKVDGFNKYYFLMKRLYSRDFIWTVTNDGNRAGDGLALRDQFNDEVGCSKWATNIVNGTVIDANMDDPCSVLEMLIALSIRCENDIMYNPNKGDRSGVWFWLMLQNCGLYKYRDEIYDESFNDEVDRIIDKILNREYDAYGNGGLFPLKRTADGDPKDQRKVEIWYQLNTWLGQNYES